jgi:uncharacterized membrane protein
MKAIGTAPELLVEKSSAQSVARVDSVDLLRGLVMVLMALDHTRDYFHAGVFQGWNPLDLSKTNVALFLTRWITHYCAPVFVFLAGTGAFLSTTRGKTTQELSWFLLTRGLWLVFLEITWVGCLGWKYNFDFHAVGGAVIWAIGWSMVVLAALVWLPTWAISALGVTMIVAHNALDGIDPRNLGGGEWFWRILHAGGEFQIAPGWKFGAGYPLVPWIGVMAAGYGFGTVLLREPGERRKWIFRLGAVLTLLFIVLRFTNLYGDPQPWTPQGTVMYSIFSFLDCHKYPPSLCYLLMTLGPAFLLLSLLDRGTPAFLKPILVFGRVPLFYYLLHLPLIHGLSVVVHWIRLGHADWLYGSAPAKPPPEAGFDLWTVYLLWILIVVSLYPACKRFAELKRRRRDVWLSYL